MHMLWVKIKFSGQLSKTFSRVTSLAIVFKSENNSFNFFFQLICIFPLFLGMIIYANEFETKGKQKLTGIKIYLQHNYVYICRE